MTIRQVPVVPFMRLVLNDGFEFSSKPTIRPLVVKKAYVLKYITYLLTACGGYTYIHTLY